MHGIVKEQRINATENTTVVNKYAAPPYNKTIKIQI